MAARRNNSYFPAHLFCTSFVIALAACSETGTEFYPLEAGRWWHFQTQTTILDERREQRFLVANLGLGSHDGSPVSIQRQSTGREVYFQQTSRGIERIGVRAGIGESPAPQNPTLILPGELQLGGSWLTQSRLALIESRTFARQDKLRNLTLPVELRMSVAATNDTVRVPAGQFEACVRLDGTGTRSVRTDRGNATAEVLVTHQEWYAPGVGLVKATRSETSESPFLKAGHYLQELLQFER